MSAASLRELALRLKREAILVRCGGRTEKYQRDGEFGSFPADDVLALAEFVLGAEDTAHSVLLARIEDVLASIRYCRSSLGVSGSKAPLDGIVIHVAEITEELADALHDHNIGRDIHGWRTVSEALDSLKAILELCTDCGPGPGDFDA